MNLRAELAARGITDRHPPAAMLRGQFDDGVAEGLRGVLIEQIKRVRRQCAQLHLDRVSVVGGEGFGQQGPTRREAPLP